MSSTNDDFEIIFVASYWNKPPNAAFMLVATARRQSRFAFERNRRNNFGHWGKIQVLLSRVGSPEILIGK